MVTFVPVLGVSAQGDRSSGDAPRETDDDEESRDEDSASGDLETYESALYGYSITYDPTAWILVEDQLPDDDYDWVFFATAGGFVSIAGDPDYAGDELGSCVEGYLAILEGSDGVSAVRELRNEGGDEDERVWTVFSYDYDGSDAYVRSISCQALDDVTLVVMLDGPENGYDDFVDEAEQLLTGFEAD